MKRVFVYIDGFNLYHAINDLKDNELKWLDLWSLSEKLIREDETIVKVYYFTAYAKWIEEAYRRHQKYILALKVAGVTPVIGHFKAKKVYCKQCGVRYIRHEEKETDVNIGAFLVADAIEKKFDRALVISADTDLSAAVTVARDRSVGRLIDIVAPPKRMNRNRVIPPLFEIPTGKIRSSLLNEEILLENGKTLFRPAKYAPK